MLENRVDRAGRAVNDPNMRGFRCSNVKPTMDKNLIRIFHSFPSDHIYDANVGPLVIYVSYCDYAGYRPVGGIHGPEVPYRKEIEKLLTRDELVSLHSESPRYFLLNLFHRIRKIADDYNDSLRKKKNFPITSPIMFKTVTESEIPSRFLSKFGNHHNPGRVYVADCGNGRQVVVKFVENMIYDIVGFELYHEVKIADYLNNFCNRHRRRQVHNDWAQESAYRKTSLINMAIMINQIISDGEGSKYNFVMGYSNTFDPSTETTDTERKFESNSVQGVREEIDALEEEKLAIKRERLMAELVYIQIGLERSREDLVAINSQNIAELKLIEENATEEKSIEDLEKLLNQLEGEN